MKKLRHFVGGTILAWLVVGILSAGALALVELLIAVSLQLFLRSIGVLAPSMESPSWVPAGMSGLQLALALVAIAVVRGLCQYLGHQAAAHSMEGMNARLRRIALYRMVGRADTPFVSAAEINAQLADTFPKTGNSASYSATLLASAVQTVILGVFLFFTSYREALVGSVGLGALGLVIVRINRRIRVLSAELPPQQQVINEGIERVARNFILVRILRTFALEHARLVQAVDTFASHSLASSRLAGAAYSATPFLGTVLMTGLIVLSQAVFHTPGLQLVTFLYLFLRFVQSLSGAVQMLSFMNQNSAQISASWRFVQGMNADDLAAAVGRELVRAKSSGGASVEFTLDSTPPAISIQNVSFRYAGAEEDVVRNFTLSIAPGEHLAIIGPSGSGKSTLLQLVLGLLRPQAGSVGVDGSAPLSYFARPGTRVGYVGAEAFLVAGSVRDNLLYGNSGLVSDENLWAVLDSARIRSVVEGLPGKLGYCLDENGQGLSAGQQQRLCLARALLCQPALLILDEATANLDDRTEEEIADVVSSLRTRCTTLIVSHRRGMLKHVNRVVELSVMGASS